MTSPPLIVFRPSQIGMLIAVLDEPDRAVAHQHIHPAGMAAARAREGALIAGEPVQGRSWPGSLTQKIRRCSGSRRRCPV